eukprot:TRINITY_DN78811_c0_g1_i1.p1 TRINITY_DN78811_c0_g1~~TRINITY_DN78811_c0_g1_i1.p1  ORF type:complete len:226 (-),score=31.58 TRINITY_DN78811_c0_g1_i1:368-1045(-)
MATDRSRALGVVISFAAGFVDANTKVRFDAFGGMMTGNAVFLGIAWQRMVFLDVFLFASLVAGFFSGVALAVFAITRLRPADEPNSGISRRAQLPLALMMSLPLLATDAIAASLSNVRAARFSVVCAAFAMGAQNIYTSKGNLNMNTTFITGNLQKIGEHVANTCLLGQTSKPEDVQAVRQLACAWCAYPVGACAGALAGVLLDMYSLWPAALIQCMAVVLDIEH